MRPRSCPACCARVDGTYRRVLSTSFGFGGLNAALVFGAVRGLSQTPVKRRIASPRGTAAPDGSRTAAGVAAGRGRRVRRSRPSERQIHNEGAEPASIVAYYGAHGGDTTPKAEANPPMSGPPTGVEPAKIVV